MKHIRARKLGVVAIFVVISIAVTASGRTVETRIGKLDFEHGVPTKETVTKLYDEMDFQRACQLHLWALPAVTAAQARAYGPFVSGAQESRDVVIFEGYRNLSGLLTANVTTPFVGGGLDLATYGPTVVEVPAGLIAGSAMDSWEFVGEAMAKANDFDKRLPGARYRPETQWDYVIMLDPVQDVSDYSQLDERAAYFYEGIFLTRAMKSTTPGVGQAYLGGYRDKDGHAFDGTNTYHLRVPPNPPARQFWSITLYDVDTHALIQNKEQIADRSSRMPDLMKNADVDLYFGPTAPKGFENNWIPTVPGKAWFTWFRLYAPLEPYLDKSWPLPDIEKVTSVE